MVTKSDQHDKRSASKWKKTCSFAQATITEDLRESVFEQYPQLLGQTCYERWTRFLTEETLEYCIFWSKQNCMQEEIRTIPHLMYPWMKSSTSLRF